MLYTGVTQVSYMKGNIFSNAESLFLKSESLYSLTLSFIPGDGILAQVNSLHMSLSSSLLDNHLLHGNMYFCFAALSSTSTCVKCHAAPNPGDAQ